MAPSKAKKPTAAVKPNHTVTLKHLAATLADEHHLTKRAGAALLGDLVGMITKHLKKGEKSALRALVSYKSENAQPAWGAILRPVKRFKSKQARKSHSVPPMI